MYKKIKGLCEEKKISVSSLEKELGFSNGSICKWVTSMPRADALLKVATYFGVPIECLLESVNANESEVHE